MFLGMNYFLVLGSLNHIWLYCKKEIIILHLDTMASEMLKHLLQTILQFHLGRYFNVESLHHYCTGSHHHTSSGPNNSYVTPERQNIFTMRWIYFSTLRHRVCLKIWQSSLKSIFQAEKGFELILTTSRMSGTD